MALTDKLTAIADAIRSKTGSTEELTLDQMATEIEGISSGGGSASVAEKDVNFYDYDGTLLHSYTVAEAQALSELPALPQQPGLICQGWNWSLDSIKAHNRAVNVGAMYITDDGTTRIYIHLEEGRTSPMLGIGVNGTVTVDWGDGSEPNTLTGIQTSAISWTPNHEYGKAGDYVIKLSVDGEMAFKGNSSKYNYACILRYSSNGDSRNYAYQNALYKIEIGSGVTSISYNAFCDCRSLTSITIPDGITSIGNSAFQNCSSLTSITIPDSVPYIGDYMFYDCRSLTSITIPDGITSIGIYMLNYCCSLSSITIPDSVTNISDYAFSGCYSLSSIVIQDGVTKVGSSAFYSCYSLSSITIPESVTSIDNYAFKYCYGMRFFDFSNHTAVPTLSNTNAFSSISPDCEIRVPAALYDEWIAATNWSTYASQIVAV